MALFGQVAVLKPSLDLRSTRRRITTYSLKKHPMSLSSGLKFKRFDLQVHTPGSSDFKDRTATAEDIVRAALANGLSGIAITDHQSGAWIDQIKKAAIGTDLTVFPGVELRVHGGKDGIHLLAIFDVDKTSEHVKAFLNSLKVYDHLGEVVQITNKTAVDVALELQEFDKSAILILAHCLSGQGAIGDMRGDQRSELFRPQYTCLLGAEANEADFLNAKKIKDHDRVVDLFDGGFDTYHRKKLGVYQASDAHALADIGSRFTYFKVDDEITIEDIRQSLIDRDMRVRQSFEYNEAAYPKISHIRVSSGFLDGLDLEIHEGLNSFLGGKGSGKSLVVEFLRFALNQQPTQIDLLADHDLKLQRCLKLFGTVEVTIVDESGKLYIVHRTYNPPDGNPIVVTDPQDGTQKDFHIEEIFPLLFLSQNEVIKIAEDRTGGNQREFIDRFFDFRRFQQSIQALTKLLVDVDARFATSLKAHLELNSLNKRIATTSEEIKRLDLQITNTAFEKFSHLEGVGRAIEAQLLFVDSLLTSLKESKEYHSLLKVPAASNPHTGSDPAVRRSTAKSTDAVERIVTDLDATLVFLGEKKSEIQQEHDNWKPAFDAAKAAHDQVVKEAGGTQVALDQKRTSLVQGLAKLEADMSNVHGRAQQMKAISTKRGEIVSKLDASYKSYFEERKNRCDYFTINSNGTLEVSIREREDTTTFKQNLLKFKRGSWLKDDDVEMIANKISPKDFIDGLLRYEYSARAKKSLLQDISDKTGIKIENVEKLAHHLLDEHSYEEILSLRYTSVPKDVPTISYKVDTEFRKLDELSGGQKAIALLIIALSEGKFPIIVDQPEDALDLRSIWDDVCVKMRDSKGGRQFILTTHNSSVAVASDTDKFTILKATANQGKVLFSGSMNRQMVRDEVINYLEGGKDTYNQKKGKYNM
ncbi:MAG: TrlF family AAA-like ATPase [Pyrinomonadaceae bacterium]